MTPCFALSVVLFAVLSCIPAVSSAQKTVTGLRVPGSPSVRCDVPEKRFAEWELPFRLPRRLKANGGYESAPFCAVILRREREADCDGGEFSTRLETFRLRAQKEFPGRKVFASQQCPDMAAVSYAVDGRPENTAFVAVCAGNSEAEARSVLAKARKAYPGAALYRMRVRFSRIVQ